MPNVRCLVCGCVFDQALEMCPQRYLSPHDEQAMRAAAERWQAEQAEQVEET